MAAEKKIGSHHPQDSITSTLAADVSTPSVLVTRTANEGEVKVVDTLNAPILGVLPETGLAGEQKEIEIAGVSPEVLTGGAIDALKPFISDAQGRVIAVPASAGTYNIGGFTLTKADAANQFVSVQHAKSVLKQ